MDYVYQQVSFLLTKLPVPLEIISNHFVPSANTVNPLLTNRVGSTFLHLFVIPENSLQSTEAYLEHGRTCTMKLFLGEIIDRFSLKKIRSLMFDCVRNTVLE